MRAASPSSAGGSPAGRPPWFDTDVVAAARGLLGWRLISEIDGARVVAELAEVEAYDGESDPASHAFRGRTARNAAMFGPPGTLYVYRSYGIHWCMNVVSGPEGQPSAVLLRGATVLEGRGAAVERRGREDHLADGPGKLAQALGVTDVYDGHLLTTAPLRLAPPVRAVERSIATPRVGISRAVERPWRFVVESWPQ